MSGGRPPELGALFPSLDAGGSCAARSLLQMGHAGIETLIVGDVSLAAVRRHVPLSKIARAEFCDLAPDHASDRCAQLVVADASFDCFDYSEFAARLRAVRDRVAVDGDLVWARRGSTHDRFFVYRDDEFFRDEFATVWEADFEQASALGDEQIQLLWLRRRRPPEQAEVLRAQLPWAHLAHIFTFASDRLPAPRYAWVPATTRCNLRCRTCSVRNSPPGSDISDELIEAIFTALGDSLEVVNVTGIGEPLFARTWPQLRRRIREKPYRRLEIVTNGTFLTEEEVRDMMQAEHPTILIVSIDGAHKETFEYIRDRARWEHLVQTMDMIARLRRELAPGGLFSLGVDFVAVKDNIAELPELIPRLAQWGVDLLVVIEMGDWQVNRDFYYEQALRFHPRLANEYYDKARAIAARYPFRLVSIPPNYSEEAITEIEGRGRPPSAPFWHRKIRNLYHRLKSSPAGRELCRTGLRLLEWYCAHPLGAPRSLAHHLRRQLAISRIEGFGEFTRVRGFCEVVAERVYFHIDGQVATCCGLMEPKFGNLLETDFATIWTSPAWRDLRLRNLFGFPHSACYFCTLPYGLPEKNPENFMAAHALAPGENRLAAALRRWRRELA